MKDKRYKRVLVLSLAIVLPLTITVLLICGFVSLIGYFYYSSEDNVYSRTKQEAQAQPDNMKAQIKLAEIYFKYNECPLAIKYYKRALTIDDSQVIALNNISSCYETYYKDYDKAVEYSKKALLLDNKDYSALITCLKSLIALNKYEEALNLYEKHQKTLKESYELYLYKGIIYKGLTQYDIAETALNKALKYNQAKEVYFLLGSIYKKQKRFSEIQKLILRGKNEQKDCTFSLTAAMLYEEAKMPQKALEEYEYTTLCNQNSSIVKEYAIAKSSILKKEYSQEVYYRLKDYCEREEANGNTLKDVINLFIMTKNELLDAELKTFINSSKDKQQAYLDLAELFYQHNDLARMKQYLDLSKSLSIDCIDYYLLESSYYSAKKDYKKALDSLIQAEKINKDDFELLYKMVELSILLKDSTRFEKYKQKLNNADQFWQDKLLTLKF